MVQVLALGILALVGGCGRERGTTEPPGLRAPDGKPLAQQDPPQPPSGRTANSADTLGPNEAFETPPSFARPAAWESGPTAQASASSSPEVPSAEPAAGPIGAGQPIKPERDLARELITALGPPASCVDLARVVAAGGRLDLKIEAMVMPSGRISRATVSAAQQPPEALHCLEARLLAGSLPGDVPGAPIRVEASIPVEVVAHAPTPSAPAAVSPPSNVRPSPGDELAKPDGTEFARPSE